jgi:pyridoxal phosphate enzyme (YggS family)
MTGTDAFFSDAYCQLEERIRHACERSGRARETVRVIAVSKTIPTAAIEEAYQAGCRFFGESRVQEFLEKKPLLPSDIQWHFIGHLQTNKAKKIVGEANLIHSLDSVHLAATLSVEGEKRNADVPVLIQVNTSEEGTKGGFLAKDLEEACDEMQKLPRLQFRGLMTIGPLTEAKDAQRKSFRLLREHRDRLKGRFGDGFQELSMGMTQDFEIAIEEGATMLRIGTLLFGERK